MLSKERVGTARRNSKEITVTQLQEIKRLGKLMSNKLNEGLMERKLEDLSQRLARVRSWGGAYQEVDFSPEIKAFISRKEQQLSQPTRAI